MYSARYGLPDAAVALDPLDAGCGVVAPDAGFDALALDVGDDELPHALSSPLTATVSVAATASRLARR